MSIKIGIPSKSGIKVTTRIATPENLNSINNINIDNIKDGYVLTYDGTLERYAFVDPDTILSKAVEDGSDLPQELVDKLDRDLDNRINLDAGEF